MKIEDVVNGAIGPFPDNCSGYLNPGNSGAGYIAALKLSVGQVKADMDPCLEEILSFDRCERNDAYAGQINMITATSFCGPKGAIWGYDLAKAEGISEGKIRPLFLKKRHDGLEIPVLPLEPLLDATERLFGTVAMRRFPPMPGSMIISANKSVSRRGPTVLWCALAIAIAENREKDADLFIEDILDTTPAGKEPVSLDKLVECALRCGENQGVLYGTVFAGIKTIEVPEGSVGCALASAFYVTLAKNAIPKGCKPSDLLEMTISEWEEKLGLLPSF